MSSSGVVRSDVSSPGDGGDNHEDRLLLQEDHQKASLEYISKFMWLASDNETCGKDLQTTLITVFNNSKKSITMA